MSIVSEISRIEGIATSIHDKVESLGITIASPEKLADTRDAINSITSQAVNVTKLTGATTAVTISKGYYNSNATISVDTSAGGTVALSTVSQTISCSNKMMTSNITIPAANGYYTGQSSPDSSIGNDGDLYLVIGPNQ